MTTTPAVPDTPARRASLRRVVAAVAALVAFAALVTVTGCAKADEAAPEDRTFGYSGTTLNVVSRHHVPTDLVAADRQDVKVTRWFKAEVLGKQRSEWVLDGDTLTLEASCSGVSNCDARFRVEVPPHITVLRDGRATELTGKAA